MKKRTTFLLILVFLAACAEKTMYIEPGIIGIRKINFEQPMVGEKSKYLFLFGTDYLDRDTTTAGDEKYGYLPDTLIIEIIDSTEDGFKIKEQIHEVSGLLGQNFGTVIHSDQTNYYYFKIEHDSVVFHNFDDTLKSNFFIMPVKKISFALNDFDNNRIVVKDWKTEMRYCGCLEIGFDLNFAVLGLLYPRANIIVDERDLERGGLGLNFIYSRRFGIIRSVLIEPVTFSGIGWDLL